MSKTLKDLRLRRLSIAVAADSEPSSETSIPLGRAETLAKVEHYYSGIERCELVAHRDGLAPLSTVDLSLLALKPCIDSISEVEHFVLAQTYPDVEPLAPPMTKLLGKSALRPRHLTGLTHLGSIAATESLRALDLFLGPDDRGIALISEHLPFRHQRLRSHGPDFGSAAVALDLTREAGGASVSELGHRSGSSPSLCRDILTATAGRYDKAIVQNHGCRAAGYLRAEMADLDYLGADIWISFAEAVRKGAIVASDRVCLVSCDGRSRAAYAIVEMRSCPEIHWEAV